MYAHGGGLLHTAASMLCSIIGLQEAGQSIADELRASVASAFAEQRSAPAVAGRSNTSFLVGMKRALLRRVCLRVRASR
jgi:hypothetical protein